MITRSRYYSVVFLLIVSSAILPLETMATDTDGTVPAITRVTYSSVTRTWDTINLLYEDMFHDTIEVDEEVANILATAPQLVDVEIIGQSYLGRNITCLRITNELNPIQKAKTLVVAHHHGREQITVEMALRFILYLLNGYGINSTITEYVDTQEIYIIPTLNPDALDVVVNQGNHWLRKNLRPYDNDGDELCSEDDAEDTNGDGHISEFYVYIKDYPTEVPGLYDFDYSYREGIDNDNDTLVNEDEVGLVDLNRNYPYFWEDGGPDSEDVTTQVYHGTAPFSEPETQTFRDFALKHKFAMAYSLHSGTNASYFTTNGDNYWLEPVLYYAMATDLHNILPDGFYTGVQLYPANSGRFESAVSGGWGEWMYYACGNTVPITFEVYTNASVHENYAMGDIILENDTHIIREWKGIYGYFNPQKEYVDTLWDELRPAFDYLLEMTPRVILTALGISGGVSAGESVDMTMSMQCLSPRLGTKELIYILDAGGNILDSMVLIAAGQTISAYPEFDLPEALNASGYTILMGNNYTGYTQFLLRAGFPSGFDFLIISIGIGIGIAVIAIVLIIYLRSR